MKQTGSRLARGAWTRRQLLAGTVASPLVAVATAQSSALPGPVVRVADFAARGDGRTNDTVALQAAAAYIQRNGGGTLVFEPKTYIIGLQTFGSGLGTWRGPPKGIIEISGCPGKVTLAGNGARLLCAPGLRFGTFDPKSGQPTRHELPFYDVSEVASPYRAAIWLRHNKGGLEITGFDIDGRIGDAAVGGPWGDIGWQINHTGIWLDHNLGPQLIRDVTSHHHGQDAMMVATPLNHENGPPVPLWIENFSGEYNGRQGISLISGRGATLLRCKLNHTGRNGVVASNPGAGLDIEAETGPIRDVTVVDCEFLNNVGQGMVADTGDSAGITFRGCTFAGTTNYAAWPHKPRIRFFDCTFVGAIVRCFEDPAGTEKATQFHRCRFTDDPSLSPTGAVYGSRVDLGGSGSGTLFDRCSFDYRHGMQLPYSAPTTRYHDCTMVQLSPKPSYPFGRYSGVTTITAPPGVVHFGDPPEPPARIILNGIPL